MRTYISFKLLIWCLFLLLGCRHEEQTVQPVASGKVVTITDARQWFENRGPAAAGSVNGALPERTPVWEESQIIALSNGTSAVCVPLQYKSGGLGIGGLVRLLLYREQGTLQARIMKMVSDSAYFYANGEKIDLENFTGIMTFHDWQEKFLSGVSYQNGKVIRQLSVPRAAGRLGAGCQLVTITFYTRVCIDIYCETHEDGGLEYIECDGGGGGSPLPEGPLGGGGGTPRPGTPLPYTFLKPRLLFTMPGQGKDPIDLRRFLACFGVNTDDSNYQITIYVDEPSPGSGDTKNGLNVGHTFVGLKKTWADGTSVEQVFGFYPTEYSTGWVNSKFVNNGGSNYTVSATFPVSAGQFTQASNAAQYMNTEMYNIFDQNCTDAAFSIFDAAGIGLPKNQSSFPYGVDAGYSPGQLGLDLRNNASSYPVNTASGTAPDSHGPC